LSTAGHLSIFTGLMKSGFSHIFRSTVITVLMAGFLAHLILPLSSHAQKTSFTRWLDNNVVATGDENEIKLRNTIRQLPEQAGDFMVLIREASQLVANHKDDFRLKVNLPENAENQGTSWLVGQWNSSQHHKNGNNAILPDATQSIQKWISSNSLSKYFTPPAESALQLYEQFFGISGERTAAVSAIIPLVSGISINAP
jgi:hypothetical protein